MTYSVKEIFYTLQGEGANSGRPAVFLRFSGCNLWSGFEEDRPSAVCTFCDTDFVGIDGPGGGKFRSPRDLALAVANHWPNGSGLLSKPLVVCTGGEPLLQLDEQLVTALQEDGFEVAVETNGTLMPPENVDWLCVSPKAGADLVQRTGNELKLVFPQARAKPVDFEELSFEYFFLQPMDGDDLDTNIRLTLQYCLAHPQWRLSLQTHKQLGIA